MSIKKRTISLFLLFCFCITTQNASGATAYITDTFRISMRRGPTIENKILKFLPSGMPVRTLESEDGWTRIEADGSHGESITGWVLSRYLIHRHPWKTQATFFKESNSKHESELENLKKDILEYKNKNIEAEKQIKDLKTALEISQRDYTAFRIESSDYLQIKAEHAKALEKIGTLTRTNAKLKASSQNIWMATGGLILLFGLFIGFAMGRQHKKNRQNSLLS